MAKYTITKPFADKVQPDTVTRIYFDDHKDAPKGFGLRVTPAGNKAWVLNYYVKGRERRLTLDKGYPAWNPTTARKEANNLKARIISGEDILAEREAARLAEVEAKKAKAAKSDLTLGALCNAYIEQLKRDGKNSAREVENSLTRNVENAFPTLWNTPAESLDVDDFVEIVATLTDAGKLRQAAKLRAYLRAAYTVAVRARTDAMATKAMRAFKLTRNPVSDLAPISGSNNARERVLSLPELRLYWKAIQDMPIFRLHLLTGGQRVEQLIRLTSADRDGDKVTFYDGKGRRQKPRAHVIPLLPEAKDALDEIGSGLYLVSHDGGKTPAGYWRLNKEIKAVVAAMLKAEYITEPFRLGDIRRTVETRLADAGVSSDHLAHLLSHGLGGIQQRHYQRHDYRTEKLNALVKLRDLLTAPSGDVLPLRRKVEQ